MRRRKGGKGKGRTYFSFLKCLPSEHLGTRLDLGGISVNFGSPGEELVWFRVCDCVAAVKGCGVVGGGEGEDGKEGEEDGGEMHRCWIGFFCR